MDRQREIQQARNEALVGKTFEVLVDGRFAARRAIGRVAVQTTRF